MNVAKRLFLRTRGLCLRLLILFTASLPATAAELPPGTMVLATFDGVQQVLKIATSAQGVIFQMLRRNGSETLHSAPTGTLRDPSICRFGDCFYIAYTAGNFGDAQYFSIIKSRDLLTWLPVTSVDTSSLSPTHTWAPELFVDEDGSMTAFAALEINDKFKLHYFTPTNPNLTSWTPPVPVGGAFTGRVGIDPHIVKVGGTYFLSYRHYDNGGTGDYVEIATSASLTTGYTLARTGNFAGWGGGGKEGPCLTYRGAGKWRMYLSDSTQTLSPIVFSDSDDNMAAWSALTPITSDSNGPPLAHGTLITMPGAIPDFRIQSIPATQDIALSFTGNPGLNYRVQYRASLESGPWFTLQNIGAPTTTQTLGVTDQNALQNPQRFYRVITPQ